MARHYTIDLTPASISAATGLLQINAPSTGSAIITRIYVNSTNLTATQQAELQVRRESAAATGTAVTPQPSVVGDTAAGYECKYLVEFFRN